MGYRNIEMDTSTPKFKAMYESVITAVQELGVSGEVECRFNTHQELRVWRRRCYEYQKITGVAFRIEVVDGTTLILRPTQRVVDARPLTIAGKSVEQIRTEMDNIDYSDTPEVTALMEEYRRIHDKEDKTIELLKTTAKEGADGSGRSESGGDESDT